MQVSHKILVVISPMKIKQTKKHWQSCECGVFYTITHIDWHYVTSVCFTANTLNTLQITNFSFQIIVGRKSLFCIFLDSTSIFFESKWEHNFLGAPSQDRTSFFSCPWITFLDAFLKKRMAPPPGIRERSAKCWIEICNWVVRN